MKYITQISRSIRICPSGCNATYGYCHADTSTSISSHNVSNVAVNILAMKTAYGGIYGWTNTDYNLCTGYSVYLERGQIASYHRHGNRDSAVCK